MFDANDLAYLDPKYFNIIYKDVYDVTIRSRNTGIIGAFTARNTRRAALWLSFIRILPVHSIHTEGRTA